MSPLKFFGYLAYVSNLSRNRTKFDPRDISCIFIGCPYGMKGFNFFNLPTQYVIISIHVIFHETIFPYASHLDHTSSPSHENIPFSIPSPNLDRLEFNSVPTKLTPSFIPQSQSTISHTPNTSSGSNSPHSSYEPMNSIQTPCQPLRKSNRVKNKPSYCQLVPTSPPPSTAMSTNSGKSYPLSSFVSNDNLL